MPLANDIFEQAVAQVMEEISKDAALVILTDVPDQEDTLRVRSWTQDEVKRGCEAEANRMLTDPTITAAAMATRAMWSPTPHGKSFDSWSVTIAGRGIWEEARFLIYQFHSRRWWKLTPDQMPWFALSTAGGLRAALTDHKPLTMKAARDSGLYRRPVDAPNPPLDKDGRL